MILMAIASMPTFNDGTIELPAHFKTKNVCSSTVGEKLPLLKGNKQALFWKFETQRNRVSRRVNLVSSICLLFKVYQSVGC